MTAVLMLAGVVFAGETSAQPPENTATDPLAGTPAAPIVLGPRETVGKETLGDAAAKSVLGSLLGRKDSGSRKSGPKTVRDPTRKIDYTVTESVSPDLEVGARAAWDEDGLLVSCRIDEDEQKGTFQTVFLQDCAGQLLYPSETEIYKLWAEHSISVSWSSTTTVDGEVTGTESGGWSDSWSDGWSGAGGVAEETFGNAPAIWRQAGYGRAHAGIRQVGARFNVDPADFGSCELAFLAHITRPEQDPVVTVPVPFLLSSEGDGVKVSASDRETVAARSVAAANPCIEALLRTEELKTEFLAQLDDPARLLQAALAAARDLGAATHAAGVARANLVAEQSLLENGESVLEAWDQWFEQRMDQRDERRQERYGTAEPSWAKGSRKRSEKRHHERTAGLREQVEAQREAVTRAQQAAESAEQARQAAQDRFDRALEAFRHALDALRGAKDRFAEVVVNHYRCSPCEVIADHWATAARLRAMLDRLAAMIAQAQARVDAQLPAARQQASDATQAADEADSRLAELENRSTEIEQELRDAVDTSGGCLSLEPQEGWGWVNIASMDSTRRTLLREGAMMSWKSRFKGMDVRVWSKPGCLREKIENINWTRVNELNSELHDLQAGMAEAEQQAADARRAASVAQAAVDGLEAERDALATIGNALRESGIGENADDVLNRFDELSEDCEQGMKDAIRGAADARRRQGDADRRIAGASASRDASRRRAGQAADDLEETDPSAGDDDDRSAHEGLAEEARGLADGSGDGSPPDPPGETPPPETLEEAEKQREQAEQDADEAEAEADRLEGEAKELEDAVDELEDRIEKLRDRLREWRRYHRALAAYEDCLRKKQAALEELAKLNAENASALQELADQIGEAADGIKEAGEAVGELGRINEKAREASEKAGELAGKLERIGNAMEVIDAVMRADDLTPSEKLEAMSKAFEELREWLPELPGVTQMLEFYNEAMKAIAGKLEEIENAQIKAWTDLVEAGIADPEDAPPGIRKEVRKAAKIRELMKIIARNCGKPPQPPSSTGD